MNITRFAPQNYTTNLVINYGALEIHVNGNPQPATGPVLLDYEGYYEVMVCGMDPRIYPICIVDPTKLTACFERAGFDGIDSASYKRLAQKLPVVYARRRVGPFFPDSAFYADVTVDRAVAMEVRTVDGQGNVLATLGTMLARSAGRWQSAGFPLQRGQNQLRLAVVMQVGPLNL